LTETFDVAMIGAGPSGATAAKRCADYGLNTVLVEKETLPRVKLCGGAISIRTLPLIGADIPEELIEQRIKGFRFYSPALKPIDKISKEVMGISVKRDAFDSFLVSLAVKAGCKLIQATPLTDLKVDDKGVNLSLKNGENINAKLVIGADGVNSLVAQKAGIRQHYLTTQVALCLESNIPLDKKDMVKLNPDLLELYFTNISYGYGWVFPKRDGVSVGIGGSLAQLRKPKQIFDKFCRTVSDLKGIKIEAANIGAHLEPAGGFNRKVVADRTLLVGDAAGFADPFTGEGIYYAIKSGQLAADTAKEALKMGKVDSGFLFKNYAKACDKEIGKDLRVALQITQLLQNHIDTFFLGLEQSSGASITNLSTGATTYSALKRQIIPRLLAGIVKSKIRR
jgi:geranylgeranyl reductase family protein